MRKLLLACSLILIVGITAWLWLRPESASAPSPEDTDSSATTFNKKKYSTDSPSSLWVAVNKQRPLPSSYTPAKLRTPSVELRGTVDMLVRDEAAKATEAMFAAARKAGISLALVSGYRSYSYQSQVYNNFVRQDGTAAANRYSAKPGHSEHQTGLAIDVGDVNGTCQLETCFGDTPAGKWVAQNAYRYGFIIRYKEDTERQVGFSYEPWHLRYVGPELARELNRTGQTMEAFFGLPDAPDYK